MVLTLHRRYYKICELLRNLPIAKQQPKPYLYTINLEYMLRVA